MANLMSEPDNRHKNCPNTLQHHRRAKSVPQQHHPCRLRYRWFIRDSTRNDTYALRAPSRVLEANGGYKSLD